MKSLRILMLLSALVAAFAVQSIVGSTQSASAPGGASAGPFDGLHFRSIGPASMSGRIADLAVYEPNPAIFYAGTAHGGVWKTTNGGTTFEAQFQTQGLMSVGDVTVSQSNPDLVWVGSGEANNRQSTSWGDGVYKSTDGGKTYTNMGLKTSRYINRIVIDPRNNDIVFVAAPGNLWGPGGDRGVFKTTDGGRTWKQPLKVDDDTGANDLVMDPTNDQILYASTYQRRRTACCMNGGGPGSGIWKSTDGGDKWTRLTNGIPNEPMGRIGLDVYRKRPNILYALIEGQSPVQGRRGAGGAGVAGGNPDEQPQQAGGGGRGGDVSTANTASTPTGLYRSDDAGSSWHKLNDANPRPMYFSQIRIDPNDADTIFYGGVKVQHSNDGGKTVGTNFTRSIHDDTHALWIDPANSNHVIIGNDGGLAVTWDQAKTWLFLPNLPVGLFYHVSVDNAVPYNICGGMQDNYVWCGLSAVRGAPGIAGYHWTTMQGGDGFVALQDPNDFRIAYSESQDGNMVRIDRVTGETMSIRPQAEKGDPPIRWNWDTPLYLSPWDSKIIYAAGNKLYRSSNRGLNWESASADLTGNANREDIVTMGLKGSEIRIAKDDGIVAWPTIISFAESAKRQGVLWAGTDDGNVQVSRDTGRSWTNVTANIQGLPKGIWISEVAPSRFDEGTAYVTADGHRSNDFESYIFVTHDFGATWQSAVGNLKGESVKTITEDQRNPSVLYAGTETGLFVSVDKAKTWIRVRANLPTVRIDEITQHPRDNAIILATHGRAIWILDHAEPFQEYAAAQAAAGDNAAKLFSPPPSSMYRRPSRDRNYEFWGDQAFYGENPPQAAVISWLNKKDVGEVKLRISDGAGREVREISGQPLAKSNKAGIQMACWDLRVQPNPAPPAEEGRGGRGRGRGQTGQTGQTSETGQAGQTSQTPDVSPFGAGCPPIPSATGGGGGGFGFGGNGPQPGPFVLGGTYTIALIVDGKTVDTKPMKVTDDPEVVLTSVERKRQYDMAMEMHALQPRITDADAAYASLNRQSNELTTTLGTRSDVPADVKSQFDAFKADLAKLAPQLAAPTGGRGGGGGRGGNNDNLNAKLTQAKTSLMGGMVVGDQATRAFTDVKAQTPKTITDLNAVIAKAGTVSAALAKYSLTLTVPQPVKPVEAAPAKKGTSSPQK